MVFTMEIICLVIRVHGFFTNDDEENLAKVEVGLLPAGKAGSLTVNGGEDLVMFESSDKKEASWVFAMFLMSEFSQTAQAVGGGHLIPTVKTNCRI